VVLTTKNKETKHHIHPKHKRVTEKNALANRTIYSMIWDAFYDLQPENGALGHTQDFHRKHLNENSISDSTGPLTDHKPCI